MYNRPSLLTVDLITCSVGTWSTTFLALTRTYIPVTDYLRAQFTCSSLIAAAAWIYPHACSALVFRYFGIQGWPYTQNRYKNDAVFFVSFLRFEAYTPWLDLPPRLQKELACISHTQGAGGAATRCELASVKTRILKFSCRIPGQSLSTVGLPYCALWIRPPSENKLIFIIVLWRLRPMDMLPVWWMPCNSFRNGSGPLAIRPVVDWVFWIWSR